MPCTPGMKLRRGDARGTGCKVTCLHRRLVQEYRDERDRQHEVAVEAAIGYATEYAEYVEAHPLPTFRQWLTWSRTAPREAVA